VDKENVAAKLIGYVICTDYNRDRRRRRDAESLASIFSYLIPVPDGVWLAYWLGDPAYLLVTSGYIPNVHIPVLTDHLTACKFTACQFPYG
jgi:hypothetical protein